MRKHFIHLILLTVFLLLPLCAQAKEINRLYVWDGAVETPADGSLPAGAIQGHTRSGIRFQF